MNCLCVKIITLMCEYTQVQPGADQKTRPSPTFWGDLGPLLNQLVQFPSGVFTDWPRSGPTTENISLFGLHMPQLLGILVKMSPSVLLTIVQHVLVVLKYDLFSAYWCRCQHDVGKGTESIFFIQFTACVSGIRNSTAKQVWYNILLTFEMVLQL